MGHYAGAEQSPNLSRSYLSLCPPLTLIVFLPFPQFPVVLIRAGISIVATVLGVGFSVLGFLGSSVFGRVLPQSWTRGLQGAAQQMYMVAGTEDPAQSARRFVRDFENKYGQRHPHFQECSLREAMARSLREARFLLVYLQAPGNTEVTER